MAIKALPSQEVLRQLLDYDPATGALTWRPRPLSDFMEGARQVAAWKTWNGRFAGANAFETDHGSGYSSGVILRRKTYAHRVAWKWMTGQDPDCIDHVNGDRSDNRFANLRAVQRAENSRNAAKPATNTSGHVGVSFRRDVRKWEAYIGDGKARKRLGCFERLSDAVKARRAAAHSLGYHENHGR